MQRVKEEDEEEEFLRSSLRRAPIRDDQTVIIPKSGAHRGSPRVVIKRESVYLISTPDATIFVFVI